ncbi:MAG: hypothetical protein CM15mP49_17980 [Actinomycetota bacterium]|nr:MAG: hypothetical protein CM15mP49_17980 [Actinomycetota bacterium]
MAEVHDCFTPTELILMEDLGFSQRGEGWSDVLAGKFALTGELPINTDGGLKVSVTQLEHQVFECTTSVGYSYVEKHPKTERYLIAIKSWPRS